MLNLYRHSLECIKTGLLTIIILSYNYTVICIKYFAPIAIIIIKTELLNHNYFALQL